MSTNGETAKEALAKQLLQRAGLGETSRNKLPKLPELCEAILKQWGGYEAFAKWLKGVSEKASPMQQARIADATLRLLERNADKGGAGTDDDDLANYDEAEL